MKAHQVDRSGSGCLFDAGSQLVAHLCSGDREAERAPIPFEPSERDVVRDDAFV
jgi:hypothetical protein